MIETLPQFEPEMTKNGRWFVAVKTGYGPDSHIGNFETEAQARHWIANKFRYWPRKPDAPKGDAARAFQEAWFAKHDPERRDLAGEHLEMILVANLLARRGLRIPVDKS